MTNREANLDVAVLEQAIALHLRATSIKTRAINQSLRLPKNSVLASLERLRGRGWLSPKKVVVGRTYEWQLTPKSLDAADKLAIRFQLLNRHDLATSS